MGRILLTTGNEHQESTFDHFTYYCGKRLGTVYSWLIPVTLILTNKYEAKLGATLGAGAFIIVLSIMNTAILLNAKEITNQEIPTLYLAIKISYVFAGMFSIILILGMFSSCSTMMWSACSRFFTENPRKNRMFAIAIGTIVLILGQFSFSELLGVFYPFVGYAGLIYIGCVLWKGIKKKKSGSTN